jgi:ATP-dependent Lon protease
MINTRFNNKNTKNEDLKKDANTNSNNKTKEKSNKKVKKSIPPPDNNDTDDDEIDFEIIKPSNKLDEEFMEKCYVYGLPFNWKDEYTNTNVEPQQKKKISRIYNKAKKALITKSIQITDILKLTNITNEERINLLEKYAIMQSLDGDLSEYLKYRDELGSIINNYKTRLVSFDELMSIQKKKEELKKINLNSDDIEKKILKLDIDYYSQAQIYQKFIKLSSMSPMDSEYHKLKDWINTVIDIPFTTIKPTTLNNTDTHINLILTEIKQKLDNEIYGMEQIKEELLLILNHRLSNPNASDHSIALIGPPGVGKTKIVRTLASILSLPFEQISMGGINDGSFLDGHSYTYEGSRPGKIVESLKKLECKNGILFFDEVDKIGHSSRSQEVSNQLLHITDFTQNTIFCDKYLPELPIDLSKIWFIFSLNDENLMDPILKNRMNLIKIPGYSVKDKIQIINKFLIPEITKSLSMDQTQIILTDEIKVHIINKCSQEEGIRDLKRAIESLFRKLDILCKSILPDGTFGSFKLSFSIKNFKLPYTLNFQDINLLLKNYVKESKIPPGLYI